MCSVPTVTLFIRRTKSRKSVFELRDAILESVSEFGFLEVCERENHNMIHDT